MSIEEILGPLASFEYYVGKSGNRTTVMICWQEMLPGEDEFRKRDATATGDTEEDAAEKALVLAKYRIEDSRNQLEALYWAINRHLGNL